MARPHPKLPLRICSILLPILFIASSSTLVRALDAASIVQNGTPNGAPACMSCHGQNGEGNAEAGYPRLSGLAAGYIEHELNSFADGTRVNETMQPIAKDLNAAERKAVANYFAGQRAPKVASGKAPNTQLIAQGEQLASTGDWSKGLPACAQCHGPAGEGVGSAFPTLAGQSAAYLKTQLSTWKDHLRKNDPLGLMSNVASRLTDKQIAALSAYYANLPAISEVKGVSR